MNTTTISTDRPNLEATGIPTPARPLRDTPHQIQRLRDYLGEDYTGTALPGECAADQAIRVLREQRDLVRLAAALAASMGIDGHPAHVDGSTRPPGGLQPYQRRAEVITAMQVEPGLSNLGQILTLLPENRYKVGANRTEIAITDLLTGEVHLAWSTDWLVRSPDRDWMVIENEAFYELYEPVMPVEADDS